MLVTADNLPITERPQKNRLAAVLLYLAEREGFTRAIHGPRPAGSLAAVPNGDPAVWSNPKRSHQVGTLHQTQKNRLAAVLLYLAEREGFEPSIRG